MNEAPLILGINRTQDASICLMRGSQLEWAMQKKRLTRQQHHWGRLGDLPDVYVPRLPGHWCEVASFYHADRERVSCIDKQVWNRDDQRLVGLGMLYFLLTQAIFPGHGNEGKVMELAPHGSPNALGLPPLHVEEWQVTIPVQWRDILRERRFRYCGMRRRAAGRL